MYGSEASQVSGGHVESSVAADESFALRVQRESDVIAGLPSVGNLEHGVPLIPGSTPLSLKRLIRVGTVRSVEQTSPVLALSRRCSRLAWWDQVKAG